MTITTMPTDPAVIAPDLDRRVHGAGPADTPQDSSQRDHQDSGLPWFLLIVAVALSLGSNVFAVLQLGPVARSIGGVIYGAWPTLAFLAVALLWHRGARRNDTRHWLHVALVWILRLAVAGPAAYVSLQHVHDTAVHFSQTGAMSWAEAVGMEAVTALALFELYASIDRRRAVVDEGQADADDPTEQALTRTAALRAAIEFDLTVGTVRTAKEYAETHGVSRQYAGKILNEVKGVTS